MTTISEAAQPAHDPDEVIRAANEVARDNLRKLHAAQQAAGDAERAANDPDPAVRAAARAAAGDARAAIDQILHEAARAARDPVLRAAEAARSARGRAELVAAGERLAARLAARPTNRPDLDARALAVHAGFLATLDAFAEMLARHEPIAHEVDQ